MFKMLSKNRLHNKFCTKRPKVKLFYLVESKEREKREKLKRRRIYGKYVLYIIQVSVMDLCIILTIINDVGIWMWGRSHQQFISNKLSQKSKESFSFFFLIFEIQTVKRKAVYFFFWVKRKAV